MSSRVAKFFVLLAGLMFGRIAETLFAQVQPAPADSVAVRWLEDTESTAYEIARLRVQRWLVKNSAAAQTATVKSVAEILREAEAFAREADFTTAQILLESAWDLISAALHAAPTPLATPAAPAAWQWQREALAGIDLSRLEYELGHEDAEEFFAELQQSSVQDHANPFAGVRVQLARAGAAPWQLRAFSLLKASHDYYNGALELTAQSAPAQNTNWRAENRWEATSYRDTSGLRYWQNTTLLQGGARLNPSLRVEVSEEFRVRAYQNEGQFSPNYRHNEVGLGASYSGNFSTRAQTRYEYAVRSHPSSPQDDYVEHRLEASFAHHAFEQTTLDLQNIWRRRIYPLGAPDSTFQNTYREEYLRADATVSLTPRLSVRLEGDLTSRHYETQSIFTPDFLAAKINPKLQMKIWGEWQASVGYIFLTQNNHTEGSSASFGSSFYEDYTAHGFTLGLDLLSTKGVLLSASHVFEARLYPEAQLEPTAAYNPNPNRFDNSFLVFLSWQITPQWQWNFIANFDSQISRAEYREDLRNTIFSAELGYAF